VFRFARELPRLAREIAELARDSRADVVYVNGPRLLPPARLGLRSGVHLIFHCHSYLRQRYASALAGLSLGDSTVIANCRFVSTPLLPYMSPRQFHVVYCGAATPGCSRLSSRLPVTRIGVLGRISPEKGQLIFLEAARLLPPEYQFVICGAPLFQNPAASAYLKQLRQAAAGLPVEFLPWLDDAATVLCSLDLLIVPSAPGEATTRVILEAFAAGVPVIASAVGGIPEILSDNETGFLVPPNDPAALAARIRAAAADPAALSRIAANALRAASERYTLAQYQDRIMNILESVGHSART
jgi:glycosyltransferase involved in cell wall biosynthesis